MSTAEQDVVAAQRRQQNQQATIARTVENAVDRVSRQVLDRMATLEPDVWRKAPSEQQSDAVDSVIGTVRTALMDGFRTMLEADHAVAQGTVDSVTFKDGVKAVIKLPAGPAAHALADREGGTVLMVMVDLGAYHETFSRLHEEYVDMHDQGDLWGGETAEELAERAQEALGDDTEVEPAEE